LKLSQIIVETLEEKRALCVFEPSFGGLGAMYAVHLRLTGKPTVDFQTVTVTENWLRKILTN